MPLFVRALAGALLLLPLAPARAQSTLGSTSPGSASAGADAVDVSPRWQSGRAYAFDVAMDNTQTFVLAAMGESREMPVQMAMTLAYSARPERVDGGWRLGLTLDRSRSTATTGLPGGGTSPATVLDTDAPDTLPADRRDEVMRLVGQTTVLTFGPDFVPGPSVWPDGTDAAASPLAGFALPGGVRRVGESWTVVSEVPTAGLPLTMRTTYTLDRVAGDSLHLTTRTDAAGEGDLAIPDAPPGAVTRLVLGGSGRGTMAVHRTDGGHTSTSTLDLAGTLTMRDPRASEAIEARLRLATLCTTRLRPR